MLILKYTNRIAKAEDPRLARERVQAFRGAFLNRAEALRNEQSIARAMKALESGDYKTLFEDYKQLFDKPLLQDFRALIASQMEAGAAAEVKGLGLDRAGYRFDIRNPYAEAYLATHSATLVRGVSLETKKAIYQVVRHGMITGVPPRTQGRMIVGMVGLTERDAMAVRNMAGRMGEQGYDAQSIEARTQEYSDRLLRARGEMIARTETIRAASAGQQASWMDAVDKGYLPESSQKKWVAGVGSERTCEICGDGLHGTVVDLEDEFDEGIPYPPAHPGCRCTMVITKGVTKGFYKVYVEKMPEKDPETGRFMPKDGAGDDPRAAARIREARYRAKAREKRQAEVRTSEVSQTAVEQKAALKTLGAMGQHDSELFYEYDEGEGDGKGVSLREAGLAVEEEAQDPVPRPPPKGEMGSVTFDDSLVATQATCYRGKVEAILNGDTTASSDFPVVANIGGRMVILDGHHRILAAKLMGHKTFQARVITL